MSDTNTTNETIPPSRKFFATITGTDVVEPNGALCSPDEGFDVLLELREDDGTEHTWRSEFSGRYGVGNAAQYTQIEMTMRSLKSVGLECEPHEILEKLDTLVGKRIPAELSYYKNKNNGKVYSSIRIGGYIPIKVDKSKAADLIRKLTKKDVKLPPPPQPKKKVEVEVVEAESNPFEGL